MLALATLAFAMVIALQGQETADPCGGVTALAWVDPVFGVDGPVIVQANGFPLSMQVNDPTAPFKTLQAAIDAVFSQQNIYWQASVPTQGIVYALPGIYGPADGGGNGDTLPIKMRDRVNVQGAGARGCVIRGKSTSYSVPAPPYVSDAAYWPVLNGGSAVFEFVVLVDFSGASPISRHISGIGTLAKWSAEPDSSELLDGFTFEGGDIQIMFWIQANLGFVAVPTDARITNCVFDMRDDWSPAGGLTIKGPSIGIELASRFTHDPFGANGYHEQKVLIAQNTFVMASRAFNAGGQYASWITCRGDAVAIIDVTDSACQGSWPNLESTPRGVGRPGIFNNLFRTAPGTGMAMLGIDSSDTKLQDATTGIFTESNAFEPSRVGSDNGFFFSAPKVSVLQGVGAGMNLFDCGPPTLGACTPTLLPTPCTPALLPVPAVKIWNGGSGATDGIDPCFVGEYMNARNWVAIPLGGIGGVYHTDWRLVPTSPLADRGVLPAAPSGPNGTAWVAENGSSFIEPACASLRSMDWDMEGYGNPRIVGGRPDIGADETHGYVAAASYGNDSVSHNLPAMNLSPNSALGQSNRRLLLANEASQNLIVINGKVLVPATSPPSAWTQPPGTLSPATVRAALPQDYRTAWITFANPTPPTPWQAGTQPAVQQYRPDWTSTLNQLPCNLCNIPQSDVESAAPQSIGAYFGSQLVMYIGANVPLRWSNLQFEYR